MATRDENREFRDAQIRHHIKMIRDADRRAASWQEILDDSEPRLQLLIGRLLDTMASKDTDFSSPVTERRLTRLRNQIIELRRDALMEILGDAEEESRDLIIGVWAMLAAASTLTNPFGKRAARKIVRDVPFEGRTLRAWLTDLARTDAQRIYGTVAVGLSQGLTKRQIIKGVIGTKPLFGRNGVTQRTRNALASLAATSAVHFAAQATKAFADDRPDEFPRDLYVAVLDHRTTERCRSLDGRIFRRGDGPYPPLHFFCRSIRIAMFSGPIPDDVDPKDFRS